MNLISVFLTKHQSIKGAAICYTLCMTLVKLALGAWFYQIFRVHRLQRVTIIITVGATMVFGVTNTIASAVTCGPSAGLLGPIADCPIWPVYSGISLSWSVLNAIGDIIMAVLAVNALWSARMPLNTKIVASLILVLGTFGGVASVARLWIIAENHGRPGGSSGIKIGMWTGIEPCAGIAAANFACLRPMLSLLKRQFLRVRGMVTPQASAASGSAAAAAAAAAPKFPSLRRPRAFRSPNSTTTLTAEYAAEWELQYDNKSRMGSVSGAPLVVTEIPLEDQRVEHEHGVEQEGLELVHPGTRVMGVLPDDLEDMEITEPEPEHSDRL